MMNGNDEILPLLCALCEGTITDGQFRRMDALLRADAAARMVYRCYLDLDEGLLETLGLPARSDAAPDTTRSSRRRRAVSGAFIRYAAAAVIVLAFVGLIGVLLSYSARRPAVDRAPVATLIDAADAVWGNSDVPTTPGRQLPGGFLRLRSGTAKIEFFSGAQVTLTGPCEFGLNSPMRGLLRSGKLTAYCPPSAHGFTVGGPGVAVIDLGTWFTMSVDLDGRTDVFVREGRVWLKSDNGETQGLSAGRTARMARDQPIVVLPLKPLALDLADIVGGGNGLGTGHDRGIDPATGEVALAHHPVSQPSDRVYHPTSLPGIDGVFIPARGRQPITSTGLSLTLPASPNRSWDGIWNGPNFNVPTIAGGVDYRLPPHTIMGLHANKGITFDLRALGDAHPGYRVQGFTAVGANTNWPGDLWVLVDGRVMFHKTLSNGQTRPIGFDLHDQDRFLTVMTVGGGWLFLADAKLALTPTVSNNSSAK